MIERSEEQRQKLASGKSVVIDPETHEEYVLVQKDVYQKLKGFIENDVRSMYSMLANLDPEDWEDAAVYEVKP